MSKLPEADPVLLQGDGLGNPGEDLLPGVRVFSRQLMNARELDPTSIQGDRFESSDDDVSYAPQLEDDPQALDILPDQVRAMPGGSLEDDDNPDISARPREPYRPARPSELLDGGEGRGF